MASTSAAKPSSAMKEYPNWLEMPDEVMVDIFQRLTTVEILNSVRKVCTTWLRICENPAMWKVIDMLTRSGDDGSILDRHLEALAKEAVDLSCGELIEISMELFANDDLLDYILLRSNKLKRLCLVSCFCITDSRLSQAVKMVPHLEEFRLSDTCIEAKDLEVLGRNCPQLKSFELSDVFRATYDTRDDHARAIANSMPELRRLKLIDKEMTEDGLEAILHGCQHLESLDVRMCPLVDLDGDFGKLCIERIKDFKRDPPRKSWFHFLFSDVEDCSEGDLSETESDMYDDYSESDSCEDTIL